MTSKNSTLPKFLRTSLVWALLGISSYLPDAVNASKLSVLHPTELKESFYTDIHGLKEQGVLKSSMANFGFFNYGTTIKGRLHYPVSNTDGCEPFTIENFVEEHFEQSKRHGHRPIILVDRGTCHFVKKAQNVQNFGGMMMVVVDNKSQEDPELLIMADDGRGSSVKIPSFLIGMTDGQRMKKEIHEEEEAAKHAQEQKEQGNAEEELPPPPTREGGPPRTPDELKAWKRHKQRGWGKKVIVAAEIDLATKTSGVVDVDMWYANVYELLNSGWDLARFAEIQAIFKKGVQIAPRLITNSCKGCSAEEKKTLCIQDGRYCPVIPTDFQMGEATPQSIIDQNLRELCVFESLPVDRKSLWFSYINVVIQNCMAPDSNDAFVRPVTPACHDNNVIALLKTSSFERELKVDWDHYAQCTAAQAEALKSGSSESFLERDMELVRYVGSVFHPSISVQNHTYRGNYKDANNVFKAICSTMEKRPPICSTVSIVDPFKPYMYEDYDNSPEQQKERADAIMSQIDRVTSYDQSLAGLERRARLAEIILGLVIVVIINCACFTYCKMYNKKKTDERMAAAVNESVSQYFALAAEDPSGSNTSASAQ